MCISCLSMLRSADNRATASSPMTAVARLPFSSDHNTYKYTGRGVPLLFRFPDYVTSHFERRSESRQTCSWYMRTCCAHTVLYERACTIKVMLHGPLRTAAYGRHMGGMPGAESDCTLSDIPM